MASADDTSRRLPSVGLDTVDDDIRRVIPPVLTLLSIILAWQAFVWWTAVPTIILPSPVEVVTAAVGMSSVLLADAAVTALTAALGLAIGIGVGLLLVFAMTYSTDAARVIHPYLVALRIAPTVAVAPLLFVWFGDGIPARALLTATLTVFPVAIASYDGLRSVPQQYLDLAQSVDSSPLVAFVRVRVPAAAPSVFAGVKLAAVLSVVGAVVAEFVALDAGLGYRVFYTATRLETARTYATLVALALLGLVFYLVPVAIERRIDWGL